MISSNAAHLKMAGKMNLLSFESLLATPQGQRDLQHLLSRNDHSWANLHGSRLLGWLEPDSTLEYPLKNRLEDDDQPQVDFDEQDDNSNADQWMNQAHPWFEEPEGPEDLWLDAEATTDCLRATHLAPRAFFLRLLERRLSLGEDDDDEHSILSGNHGELSSQALQEHGVPWGALLEELINGYNYFYRQADDTEEWPGCFDRVPRREGQEWLHPELVATYLRRWAAVVQAGDILNLSTPQTPFYCLVYALDEDQSEGDNSEDPEEDEEAVLPALDRYYLKALTSYEGQLVCPEPGLNFLLRYGPEFWGATPVNAFIVGPQHHCPDAPPTQPRRLYTSPGLQSKVTIDSHLITGMWLTPSTSSST